MKTIMHPMVWVTVACLAAGAGCAGISRRGPDPNEVILRGELTADSLYTALPAWRKAHDRYRPSAKAVTRLAACGEDVEILTFLGTWCGDSRREVPKMLKVLAEAGNPRIRVRLIGVDRTKRDAAGLAERQAIQRVPTFVVLRQGREVGRLVEKLRRAPEAELLAILGEK